MRFVDECVIRIEAGNGGNGCVAFRREKNLPFGGPSGGDGGSGGHVILVGDEGRSSLLDLTHARVIRATRGEHGRGSDQYGRGGEDQFIRVPIGTIAFDHDTGAVLGELLEHEQQLIVARGGRGGRGNIHFMTPTDRAPQKAEQGTPGEQRNLRLELRVMADVGLLGFPNVGKSTFISAVSQARPKIADYPFTTLVPQLGVVQLDRWVGAIPGETFIVADIPGLIPGASEGAGLGIQFLRHLKRTRVILHLLTLDYDEARNPLDDYETLRRELARFSPELAERPEIVALSKGDITEVAEAYPDLQREFQARGVELHLLSAATHTGISALIEKIRSRLQEASPEE